VATIATDNKQQPWLTIPPSNIEVTTSKNIRISDTFFTKSAILLGIGLFLTSFYIGNFSLVSSACITCIGMISTNLIMPRDVIYNLENSFSNTLEGISSYLDSFKNSLKRNNLSESSHSLKYS
jgi:uncharacterized membrane protein